MSSQGNGSRHDSVAGRHGAGVRPLTSVKTRQEHIAGLARKYTDSPIMTLGHHMDRLWMREAFFSLKKGKATGIDGITMDDYAENLDVNLAELLELAKSGRYIPLPVKRVHIPKNEKETRPIGILATGDKVLEKAVTMLLEPIYENDFLDCSYGFRPHRSTHQALEEIRGKLMKMDGGWVLDVDIRKYFDSIPHAQLKEILRLRIKDTVILRLIAKWLRAGVWENGKLTKVDEGTPQGGIISPLLSNIYLHEVLDLWFEHAIKPRLKGEAHLIRYADDFVILFKRKEDALRVMEVLPKRCGKYGLEIHEQKTQLVDLRHPWESRKKPETFEFLGFTHYWKKTHRGGFAINRKTSSKKMRTKLMGIHQWCKKNRHKEMEWQYRKICEKLQGHYAYYGIRGNSRAIASYRYHVTRIWRYWLNRRSRKRDGMKWKRFSMILKSKFVIPPARIVHKAERELQLALCF